jgi:hypothetical protein
MESPAASLRGGRLSITYDFEQEDGSYALDSFRFEGVEAFRFTLYETCEPEQVEAYDMLIDVEGSSWLRDHRAKKIEDNPDLKHYRVFFDEIGCYDIIATSFFLGDS